MNTLKDYVNFKLTHADKVAEAEGYPLKMDNCKKYKRMKQLEICGNTIQSNLPLEYQQVDWIEHTGKSIINTNYIPTINTKIVYEVQNNSSTSGFETGVRMAYQDNQFVSTVYSTTMKTSRFYYADNEYEDFEVDTSQKHIYEMNGNGTYYIDGELKTTKLGSFTLEYPIYISHFNEGGKIAGSAQNAAGKIYSYKIYENDELQRDFIPCYRRKCRTIGLYDLVNGVFYKCSADNGNYTNIFAMSKGNDYNAIPSPENPVEVQSIGSLTKNLLNDTTFKNSTTDTGFNCDYEGDGVFHIYGEHNPSKASSGTVQSPYFALDIPVEDADSYYSTCVEVIDGTTGNINTYFFTGVKNETSTAQLLSAAIPAKSVTGYKKQAPTKLSTRLENATNIYRAWLYFTFNHLNEPEYLDYRIRVWFFKGEVFESYEPYGKYKIPLIIRGKNITTAYDVCKGFAGYKEDTRDDRECVSYGSNGCTPFMGYQFKEKTQYTISFEAKSVLTYNVTGFNMIMRFTYTDGTYGSVAGGDACGNNSDGVNSVEWKKFKITSQPGKTIKYICTDGNHYSLRHYIDVNTFQLEEGATATEYEPYQAVTTNIFLDEPLRKIGDYADYIDFKSNKLHRFVHEYYIDGSQKVTRYDDITCLITTDTKCKGGSANAAVSRSNRFGMMIYTTNRVCAYMVNANGVNLGIANYSMLEGVTDAETLKQWLTNNPTTCVVPLSVPTEEPLNINLPKLTAKTTIIEVDTSLAPSNAYGKYIKR